MQRTVDTFFKYAMLSHRWGAEDDEPTYHHIKDAQSIYDLKTPPEIFKLQQFCKTARENQHRWAWSDTCCIDKADNTELQASIMSMFLWYRLSSITIVYLSDVTDEESFRRSGWFTRGWTLPELIAPETVWFYKKDWTPYIDIDQNHKNNSHVATVISEIASIDRHSPRPFCEIKKRMGWLASRTTTKIEDMAYCMMGILGVHMPVMYGEKEYAFVRLQKEILYLTEDLSLFDWVGEPSKEHSYLASHPHCFAQTEAERTDKPDKPLRSLTFTGVAADLTAGLIVGLPATFGKNIRKHLNGPPHWQFHC
ncbi:heterokaryon incompatibility protein-domain-containing protein [Suillus lakei]|nr:heterokaryon incompatibility protein-domain-containing protein [Suillus lakei]